MFNRFCNPAFIAILILLVISCKEEKTEKIVKYPNGTYSKRIPMVNGKKNGEMLEYFPAGELKSTSQFIDDRKTGKTVYYYKSGKVRERQFFQNDKLQKGDTTFYINGNIESIVEYTNGVKNGYVKKFDSTGLMYFNSKYKMDTLVEVNGVVLQR